MKNKSLSKSVLPSLLISAIALTVSACGGGGSSGGGGGGAAIASLNSFIEKQNVMNINSADEITDSISGVGTPTSVSSREASHADGRTDAFVFQSSTDVEVIAVFTEAAVVEIDVEQLTDPIRAGMNTLNTDKTGGNTTPSFAVTFPVSGGSATRNYRGFAITETDLKYGSGQPINVTEALVFTTRSETANDDTDYVTFGVWLIDRHATDPTPNPPIEVAAFASGGGEVTPTSYIRPTEAVEATYTGNAIMMTGRKNTGAATPRAPNSIAYGELSLTAMFDSSSPTVSGEISSIATVGTDTTLPSSLTLGSADITDVAGGFFSGKVIEGLGDIGDWGGNFYGDQAGVVSGTFSVDTSVSATATLPAGRLHIVGAFGAEKEE